MPGRICGLMFFLVFCLVLVMAIFSGGDEANSSYQCNPMAGMARATWETSGGHGPPYFGNSGG
jgi:hypothetical protein